MRGDKRLLDRPRTTKAPRNAGLSHKRLKGLEPSTFCMASRRSSQLSYSRKSGQYRRKLSSPFMPPTEADAAHVRAAYAEFNARFQQLKTGDLTGFEDYCAPDVVL